MNEKLTIYLMMLIQSDWSCLIIIMDQKYIFYSSSILFGAKISFFFDIHHHHHDIFEHWWFSFSLLIKIFFWIPLWPRINEFFRFLVQALKIKCFVVFFINYIGYQHHQKMDDVSIADGWLWIPLCFWCFYGCHSFN